MTLAESQIIQSPMTKSVHCLAHAMQSSSKASGMWWNRPKPSDIAMGSSQSNENTDRPLLRYTRMHIYTDTNADAFTSTHTPTHTHSHRHIHKYRRIHIYTHTQIQTNSHIHIHRYRRIHIYTYTDTHAFTYTHTQIQTNSHIHIHR